MLTFWRLQLLDFLELQYVEVDDPLPVFLQLPLVRTELLRKAVAIDTLSYDSLLAKKLTKYLGNSISYDSLSEVN